MRDKENPMAKKISLTESNGTLVGPLLQVFFLEHLTRQKRVSPQTIHSYRDSFRLLLHFLHKTTGKEPARLVMTDSA
jgi:hypothetical protein